MNAVTAGIDFERVVRLRREFHQYPELAFQEKRTAERIIGELARLGIPWEYAGPGHAVIGRLGDREAGTSVALRAEMDALPTDETTGLPWASQVPGRAHACGHDAHMAMLLGAAQLLSADPPAGQVVFIFQPAEERGSGANQAIDAGALRNVKAIYAGHVTHDYPTGMIMVGAGAVTAQSDRFGVRIKGKGGHGARPHEAIDAVVIAAFLVTAIQTLVSRETNPLHPSVVTVGKLEAGSAANVIAENAFLEGTMRTTDPLVRDHLHKGLRRMCEALATLHDCLIEVDIKRGNPPVVNTDREAATAAKVVRRLFGEEALVNLEHPSMGSEDFSLYLEKVPGAYVRFGARRPDWEHVPLHSPGFDVDEESLSVGARFFDGVARETIESYRDET